MSYQDVADHELALPHFFSSRKLSSSHTAHIFAPQWGLGGKQEVVEVIEGKASVKRRLRYSALKKEVQVFSTVDSIKV